MQRHFMRFVLIYSLFFNINRWTWYNMDFFVQSVFNPMSKLFFAPLVAKSWLGHLVITRNIKCSNLYRISAIENFWISLTFSHQLTKQKTRKSIVNWQAKKKKKSNRTKQKSSEGMYGTWIWRFGEELGEELLAWSEE